MRLQAWNTVWQDFEFDKDRGSARSVWLRSPQHAAGPGEVREPRHGFGAFERSVRGARWFFALYRKGESLFFSAGSRRWDLEQPGLGFSHVRLGPFLSCFRVLESGRTAFTFVYWHVGRFLVASTDPTYDGIDEDADFFLVFVAEYASRADWQANVRQNWSSAEEA